MKNVFNPTIYTTDLRNIKEPENAWRAGIDLFRATWNGNYITLDKELLFKFLKMAKDLQDENGNIALFKDEAMPGDARIDIIYKPTYATAVVAIYAFKYYEADFDESMMSFFKKLINAFDGIKGHGFEAAETVCETMEMLRNVWVKRFIKKYPELSESLNKTIERYLKEFKSALASGENITHGFDDTPVNVRLQKIVSFWEDKTESLFVYGTLLKGERAHHLLDDSDFCGRFVLKDCSMYNLGNFPGVKRNNGGYVVGEVYFVSKETLEKIDQYESEGSLYNRTMVKAINGDVEEICYSYFYCGEVDEDSIIYGPWNVKGTDYVWYAGYGSNLSEERFKCYIKGGICNSNGIRYNGCSDKSDWVATKTAKYKGKMYFGNQSRSWCGKGVAFFDETAEGTVHMKLYKITREQLNDVQFQEGHSTIWYGRKVFLGFDDDGCEIYTLTSENIRPETEPAPEYLEIIEKSLKKEFNFTQKYISSYIKSCKIDA